MKVTYKQIARSAGYVAVENYSSNGNYWSWKDTLGSNERNQDRLKTEEEAYEDCCIACKLVQD